MVQQLMKKVMMLLEVFYILNLERNDPGLITMIEDGKLNIQDFEVS